MKKAILRVLGIALVIGPAMVGFAQNKKPTAAFYITKEQVDTVNKTPGVDRTIQVMDIGDQHFSVGIIHRGATTAPAAPAAPSAAPASAERPASEPHDSGLRAPEGLVVSVGAGAQFTGGEIALATGLGAAVATVDLEIGAYVTPHLGILGGLRLGYLGYTTAGICDACTASTFQLPLVVQYAFEGRQQGAYLEGGLGLLSSVGARTPGSESPLTLTAGSAADLKLGAGWRFAQLAKDGKRPLLPGALDLKASFDVGRYSTIGLQEGSKSTQADIAEEKRTLHFSAGLTLAYAITP